MKPVLDRFLDLVRVGKAMAKRPIGQEPRLFGYHEEWGPEVNASPVTPKKNGMAVDVTLTFRFPVCFIDGKPGQAENNAALVADAYEAAAQAIRDGIKAQP